MKKSEILELLFNGAAVKKQSYTKYKRNKIVRGSFYEYTINDHKITERQFDAIEKKLALFESDSSSKTYVIKPWVDGIRTKTYAIR